MLFMDCKMLDVLRGRRRLRVWVCKPPCSFWFLLLFAVGGLVLFIHLQDLSDMVLQQSPGVKFRGTTQSRQEQCAQFSEILGSVSARLQRQRPEEGDVEPISPMQLPNSLKKQLSATPGSREQDSQQVTKRHRKLLKTSAILRPHTNTSSSSSSAAAAAASLLSEKNTRRLSDVQEARKRIVREVCGKYRSNISRTITPHHVSRIYVEDRHKLLYCEVPKAGCSNWKRVLMVLAGVANSTQDINHVAVHYDNHLKRLDSFDRQGITKRLETYTKVLFVREPMERLVSAFRDKFESPNSYYHPVFGKPIISKYRVNASQTALKTGSGVTFREFIHYLLDVHRPVGMDIHWEATNQLCSPCHLRYDFIGKVETLEEDANFLLRKIKAPESLTYPSFKDGNPKAARTSTQITQHYFSQLNASERQRAYDFYYMDYLMFNYSKPYKDLY